MSHRHVVVTGAAGGIGAAIVRRFLDEGSRVSVLDVDASALEQWRGVADVSIREVDIADADGVERVVAEQAQEHGRLDVAVNAAGVYRSAPVLEFSPADLEFMFRVNVLGALHVSQAAARRMVEQGGGAIVNVSSIAAERCTPTNFGYAATKGALNSLTKGMAMALAPHRVRVNAVAPGPVATAMTAGSRQDPEYRRRMVERIPMGRDGEPENIAEAVAFLAGDAAGWVTGVVMPVDGGATALR